MPVWIYCSKMPELSVLGQVYCKLTDTINSKIMSNFTRPAPGDCNPYFERYTNLVEDGNVVRILRLSSFEMIVFLENLSDEQWEHRYAPGKWSVKESLLHMIDTERIMAYRALRIARGDTTEMPGFDQDAYVPHSAADQRSPHSLIEEYQAVRNASVQLFKHMPVEAWDQKGSASGHGISVRALAYIIAGHELHHKKIFKTLYLKET